MFIYTVREGDTLRRIAEKFRTSTRELERLNELGSGNILVPGLHVLVPGQTFIAQPYKVKQGDTLASAAKKFGVTPQELAAWLGLAQTAKLPVGKTLYVPKRLRTKRQIEVNTYILPTDSPSDEERVRETAPMTYLSIFSYQARADGTLRELRDQEARRGAQMSGIAPLMTVTNFDGNNFNTELAHTLLTNKSLRNKLENTIVQKMKDYGFRGVNVDFEHMRPGDRQPYNEFIASLGQKARAQNFSISIAMGPKTSDDPQASWMGAFDYKTLGAEVDFLMLMTYEWGWVGGPPMATNLLRHRKSLLKRGRNLSRWAVA